MNMIEFIYEEECLGCEDFDREIELMDRAAYKLGLPTSTELEEIEEFRRAELADYYKELFR